MTRPTTDDFELANLLAKILARLLLGWLPQEASISFQLKPQRREGRACQAWLSEILSSQAFCFVVVVVVKSLLVFFVVFCFLLVF